MSYKVKTYAADMELDFKEDPRNANKGTERGKKMLDKSIKELGAGRSILVDKNGLVIAGNKTRQTLTESGLRNAIVVETDGTQAVEVKRMDLDLTERRGAARKLAYADNRVAEKDLKWDKAELADDADVLRGYWTDEELDKIIGIVTGGEVNEIDVSKTDAQFWIMVRGKIGAQPDVIHLLRESIGKLPGVEVEFGSIE
jgi:hypothetical protein